MSMGTGVGVAVGLISAVVAAGGLDAPPETSDSLRARARDVLARALKAAEAAEPLWARAYALADLAAAQARLGDRDAAAATFRRAAALLEREDARPTALSKDEARVGHLAYLAQAHAAAGDRPAADAAVAQAVGLAKALPERRRYLFLYSTATRLARSGGDGATAREIARAVPLTWQRGLTLARVGQELAKLGDLKQAGAALDEAEPLAARADADAPLPDARNREVETALMATNLGLAEGLADVAAAEADAGRRDAALALAARARVFADRCPDSVRPQAVARVAMAHRRAGDRPTADHDFAEATQLAVAPPAPGPDARPTDPVDQLARIAWAQADAGDRDAARTTLALAERLQGDRPRGGVGPQTLTGARARVGDWNGSLALVGQVSDRGLKMILAEQVARQAAEAGADRDALSWVDDQTDLAVRANALLGVVRGLARRAGR